MTKVALLLTTYNWPEALSLVLDSVSRQSRLPDEVVIADDGSLPDTTSIIKKFEVVFPNKVNHVWQEDLGFRKTIILNKALLTINSDYIVQIDGDCILHRHFIKDHLRFSEKNTYLFGSRVNLNEHRTEDVIQQQKFKSVTAFSRGINRRTRAIHLPLLSELYKSKNKLSSKVRGCNFSYWRSDVLKINGYDESYIGWGRSDSDFAARLLHSGVLAKRIRYAGIVYHLWHKVNSKAGLKRNSDIFEKVMREKIVVASKGLKQRL